MYGTEAERAASLHQRFDALKGKIDYLPETLVWNISPNTVHLASGTRYQTLTFDSLIVCSGATDRLMPVKGWHQAGTYSLGGAQVALKSQGCAIGSRIVMMGSGPLLYLVAAQYVKAGAQVAAVLDTSTFMQRVAALPRLLAIPAALKKGIALTRVLAKARVPVHRGVQPLEIKGSPQQGVSGVVVALPGGEPSNSRAMPSRSAITCVPRRNLRTSRGAASCSMTTRSSGFRKSTPTAVVASRASIWRATAQEFAVRTQPNVRAGSLHLAALQITACRLKASRLACRTRAFHAFRSGPA